MPFLTQGKTNWKYILIVIILAVIVGGGILAWQYFWSPKKETRKEVPEVKVLEEPIEDETANWKVYRNERFKYEIKYPPDLEMLKEIIERSGMAVETASAISWAFPIGDTPNIAKSISVRVVPNTEKKSLRSVLEYDPAECKIEKEQEAFLKINCEMEGKIRLFKSAFSRNEWVYIISLEIISVEDLAKIDFSSEIGTYDLMLSTFKFLEGEVTVPVPKTPKSVKDVYVMTYMSQIGTVAQIYYDENSSYLNLATDREIKNLQQEIQNKLGWGPRIITSDNAYCVDVVLSDEKTRYCVDSEGRQGENLGCSSAKLICISY